MSLQTTREHGLLHAVVDRDCLPLIQKLQNKVINDSSLGLIISDILELA